MRIAYKIPMAEELAAALCAMSDKDAGAAFKAALVYYADGIVPVLPSGAKLAFAAMRELIDLSRMKSAAGRAGGKVESFSGGKQTFAGSNAGSSGGDTAGSTAGSKQDEAPKSPDSIDILGGLEAFL